MNPSPVVRLDGAVRDYAWGSTVAIQELAGLPVDGRPVAELWFGAHPDDPAALPDHATTLDAVIAADPAGALGLEAVDRFGPHLPFLLKVLAADTPLSIQVHPTLEQAREGFAREDADGIDRAAPQRNYRDPNHKPELLCALTGFEALCGFRAVSEIQDLIDALAVPQLIPLAEWLGLPHGLQRAFTALLRDAEPQSLAYAVADAAPRLPARFAGAARAVELAHAEFPGDIGVVLSLLLNYVRLEPGEAIYLAAGNVHAYLRGTGIEIMANSDNVLRCGLTAKHIDVDELVAITDFRELPDPRWPVQGGTGRGRFVTPAPDFALAWMDVSAAAPQPLYRGLPQIVLCTSGTAEVVSGDTLVRLAPGQAAFVFATAEAEVRGAGRVFLASTAVIPPSGR